MRDFTARMRSPSPETSLGHSLSEAEEPSSTSKPSPPVKTPYRAEPASRAAPGRNAQQDASIRHPIRDHDPHHDGTPPAAEPSVGLEFVTALGSGRNSLQVGGGQAEQSSALLPAVPDKQAAPMHDATQQTVSSPERPALSDKRDACVQSDVPIMPNNDGQLLTAVPTDERGSQTPIGHARPRPLQKALPGRDPEWSPRNAAQGFETHSPAQAHSYSLRHETANQLQGTWPRSQSPSSQWAIAAFEPLSHSDSVAAQKDSLSLLKSPAPDQQLQDYPQQSAQRSFASPAPGGGRQQPAMQPVEHLPAEQQVTAPNFQAQQQESNVHISAEAAALMQTGDQDSTHLPVGTSSNPADATPSAGVASCPAQPTVGAAMGSGSKPMRPATAPPTTSPTQAQAEVGSALPSTPAGLPYMAELPLQSRPAHMHAHLAHPVPSVPHHQTSHLPGESYPYRQPLPHLAQPTLLHADARGTNTSSGPGQRAAAVSASVSVMQRQEASHGMYGLQRRMYTGASSPIWSAQILYPVSQLLRNHSHLAHAPWLH